LLTFEGYQDIGGTAGALARRAEELFNSFNDDEKFVTRQMFLRLVTPGEGTEDTRRRILQGELLSIDSNAKHMEQVIEQFGKYRLLTFDRDPATRSSTIEVAHEALIRQWERLRGWLDENREGLRLHRWLHQSAQDWQEHDRLPDFLARGIRLERLEEWSADSTLSLNDLETAYLNASVKAHEDQEETERLRQEREDQLERQSRNRLRVLAVFSAIAALGGAILASLAISGESRAVSSANIALTAQAIAERNESIAIDARNNARGLALAASARNARLENEPPLALALIQEAIVAAPEPGAQVRRTIANLAYAPGIRSQFTSHRKSVTAVDYTSDGRFSVSASLDNTIQIYDLDDNSLVRTIPLPEIFVTDVAVNPVDNTTILATFKDGTVRLYNFETGEALQVINGHENGATSVVFMPGGQRAISSGEDKIARLWDLQTGEEIRAFEGHRGVILQIAISPDGSMLATSSGSETLSNNPEDEKESNVRIWNISDGSPERIITPASGFVRALDFSPDGNFVAIGVWDSEDAGTIRIYDLLNGFERYRFFAHPNV
ncbi:MAG: WD40 repeat domain-containing protein, partial [Aggregatilineales bacterium]